MAVTQSVMMCLVDLTSDKPYVVDGIGRYKTEEEFITAIKIRIREIKARHEYEQLAKEINDCKIPEESLNIEE